MSSEGNIHEYHQGVVEQVLVVALFYGTNTKELSVSTKNDLNWASYK
jgi:hypothetical protein